MRHRHHLAHHAVARPYRAAPRRSGTLFGLSFVNRIDLGTVGAPPGFTPP
jgi:hypothetical protein